MDTVRKAVLILLACSLVTFGYATYIEKSWEEYGWKQANPFIEQAGGYWIWTKPYVMDDTLSSLKLDSISRYDLDSREAGLVVNASDSRANATTLALKCLAETEYAEKTAIDKGMTDYSDRIRMYTGVGVAFGPAGEAVAISALVLSVLSDDAQHRNAYLEYCSGYGLAWESTMSDSMDALASSMDKVDGGYSAASEYFDSARQAGMCDSDYAGAGHQECLDVQEAFAIIDGNSTEGSYGTYNTVQANLGNIRQESGQSMPDMSDYSTTMNLIWKKDSGVLAMLGKLQEKVNTSKKLAEESYLETKSEADSRKNGMSVVWKRLEENNLEMITSAYTINGAVGGSSTGTIAERYAEKTQEISNANLLYGGADSAKRDIARPGFLKDAINKMSAASADYESLVSSLPILETEAGQVVSGERDEASARISDAQGLVAYSPASRTVLDELDGARLSFSKGENETNLGKRFGYYSESAAQARKAATDFNTKSFNESIELLALKDELGAMITKANADGLSTYSQKKALDSIGDSDYSWARGTLLDAENEIVGMAQARFGGLESKRAGLLEKIALVGGGADDQLTEMSNAERGIVGPDGKIDYKAGLGSLKALEDKYDSIDKVVETYMQDIVRHSTMVDSEAMIDEVRLDTPSKITMDFLVINTNQFGAQNVKLDVKLPVPASLMYSDIREGSESVSSLAMNGPDSMTMYMKSVEPYARKRVSFETSETIAHTVKETKRAVGLGDGSASVDEETDFSLDSPVNSLSIPDGMRNARIDGLAPGRPLAKGTHHLSSSYLVADAYNESVANLRVTALGLNSQADYDVVLDPGMDLDSVTVFIDPGAKILDLNAFTLSGEGVGKQKKITESRYSYEVSGLSAGKEASIRVSYVLENTSSYVSQKLAALDGGNYSDSVTGLLAGARADFDSGDPNSALSKVQQAEAEMKKEDAEKEKTARKVASIRSDIQAELDEIDSALAGTQGAGSGFAAKLSARASELRGTLDDSSGKQPDDALTELGAVDLNWKNNAVKAFRKDAFDEYNKLRLRFAAAGNTSTPEEFLSLESDLNKLDVSGKLVYAMGLESDLKQAEGLVESQESTATESRNGLKDAYGMMRDSVRSALTTYESEAASAKGTDLNPIFTITGKDVDSKITELDKLVQSGDLELAKKRMGALNGTLDELSATMALLRTQSLAKLDLAEKSLNESRAGMAQQDQSAASLKIDGIRKLIAAGQYVNAIRAGNTVLDDIQKAKGTNGNSLLLLGVSAIAVLAVVAAYILKQREVGKPGGKQLKRLERADEGGKTGPGDEERNE